MSVRCDGDDRQPGVLAEKLVELVREWRVDVALVAVGGVHVTADAPHVSPWAAALQVDEEGLERPDEVLGPALFA